MCLVSVLRVIAGEFSNVDIEIITIIWLRNEIWWNGNDSRLWGSPKTRPSAASIQSCKPYKAKNFKYKHQEIFFFHKSRTNLRNQNLILTSPFAVPKVNAAVSKILPLCLSLKKFKKEKEKLGRSNEMSSYLWNVLMFANFAESQLQTT